MGLYDNYSSPYSTQYGSGTFDTYDGSMGYNNTNLGQSMGLDGLFGDTFDGITTSGVKDVMGGLGGLYQLYQGNKMLGLYEDQINNSKTAMNRNIADMDRRDRVRGNWNSAISNAGA